MPQVAPWARTLERSLIRQMIQVISKPGILSLAGGLPRTSLLPSTALAEIAAEVLLEDPRALQYAPPHEPLRDQIATLMRERGGTVDASQIFLTTGAQQALDLLSRLLITPGDSVIVEERIYTGLLQAIQPLRPRLLTVPTDLESGMDVAAVARLLEAGERPAFIYTIPDGHNPTGVSMPLARRQRLVALAREYRVPIVEDDPYSLLSYDDAPLPSLRALEPTWVLYVGSFSKIIAPSLRLGWMVIPEPLVTPLMVVKEACDLETSALIQRMVSRYLAGGAFPGQIERLRAAYGAGREAMLSTLDREAPSGVDWSRPTAGMFVWLRLPAGMDGQRLLERCVAEAGVAFLPGRAFAAGPVTGVERHARLNFTHMEPAEVARAVTLFCEMVRSQAAAGDVQ